MGLCLIAATSALNLNLLGVIFLVALGLGTVIFVHELGHFAVAKMCGVKCEKFFIGFDIGGYKLSKKWGETEYGIGILPLGGYVKMLGQDDNPSNIAEQMEKSQLSATSPYAKAVTGPNGETYYLDNRSYLAKSVPQRMAIISAGVIMNIIFAFVFAFWAFGIGVPEVSCKISGTSPGSPAWVEGLDPGDEIVKIGDRENPSFDDLRSSVMLGDLENGIPVKVKKAGSDEVVDYVLKPTKTKLAKIGVVPPYSMRLVEGTAVFEGTPADKTGKFEPGDEVVKVNGQDVTDYQEFAQILIEQSNQPLEVVVQRGGKVNLKNPFAPRTGGKEITVTVEPTPLKRLGLVMPMEPIAAVQKNSPAEEAGLKAGDVLVSLNGKPIGAAPDGEPSWDPILLPQVVAELAREGERLKLGYRRGSDTASQEVEITPRKVTWLEEPATQFSLPELGLSYPVTTKVERVVAGSPAEQEGLQAGDQIIEAEAVYPKGHQLAGETEPVKFTAEETYWAGLFRTIQLLPPTAKIKLTYTRGEATREATLEPQVVDGRYWPDRGFNFDFEKRFRVAKNVSEQLQFAREETVTALTMVYRFLQKLGSGQVPATALGGPISIAKTAGYAAYEGLGKLLMFLVMLSANLAVVNFLPIPVLDGGHMVFLLWEGVRGRPASERVIGTLTVMGFALIVGLMLFVFALDLEWIDRGL